MNQLIKKDVQNFKPDGPFYDMVTSFTAAVLGLQGFSPKKNYLEFNPDSTLTLAGGRVSKENKIKVWELYQYIKNDDSAWGYLVRSLCAMLANTAYESVKDKNDKSVEFEFFRHIRNASSHKNEFFFTDLEPSRPASWRGLIIDHTKKGKSNPLFGDRCFPPFLGPSDLILLLSDIEQKL